MKDLPALLCAVLSTRGEDGARALLSIFERVIDSPKMLRNFVQIMQRRGRAQEPGLDAQALTSILLERSCLHEARRFMSQCQETFDECRREYMVKALRRGRLKRPTPAADHMTFGCRLASR